MEVAPAIVAAAAMALTYKTFRLTPLLYWLILAHCVVLMVGGKYTYAHVPLFDDIKDALGGERNNYDKVGHFMQGCVPVLVAREIILRKRVVSGKYWAGFFSASFCLAFSALYEMIEWGAAVALGKGADAFLGTQGYAWDTQSDMAFALIGAVFGLLAFSRLHDAQITKQGTGAAPI